VALASELYFDPFTTENLANPYPLYARLRAEDPLHWSPKLKAWLVTRHRDVRRFFQDDDCFSADRGKAKRKQATSVEMQPGTFVRTISLDPPENAPVRTMMTQALTPALREMPPLIDTLVEKLLSEVGPATSRALDQMELKPEADLVTALAYPLPIGIITELFGIPQKDRAEFRGLADEIARGMDQFFSSKTVGENLRKLGAYLAGLVTERRTTLRSDLISELLEVRYGDDRLNDIEVIAMSTALVFGGYETTVNLISNGMLALLEHPEQKKALAADSALAPAAIEEMLRFDTPPQAISRTAAKDFVWLDKKIHQGDLLLGCLGSANRDAEVFRDPDRFQITRDPNPHIAFGLGAHFCPGAQLSRLEARAAIPALLERFPRIRLAGPPLRRPTFVLRGLDALPVHLS
jgi:cytochrome P450